MKTFLLLFSILIFSSCSLTNKKDNLQKLSTHAIDLLQGHWMACDSNGKESILIEYVFIENKMYMYLSKLSEPDCDGYPLGYAISKSVVEFGELGESKFVKGATDLNITPNLDIFGCGAENSSKVVLMFYGTDYSKFHLGGGSPTCDIQLEKISINDRLTFLKRKRF